MTLDRGTWERKYRQGAEDRAAEQRASQTLQRLRQAAVPLERLTGSEHWDTYLRLVERLQETDRAKLAELQARAAGAAWLGSAHLARLRHDMALLQCAISTRAELTELPKAIIQDLQAAASPQPTR